MLSYEINRIATQKARGVSYLTKGESSIFSMGLAPPHDVAVMTNEGILGHLKAFPRFARPCPMRPRHGFVESRLVKSFDELASIWQEARAADDGAEVLLMPKLSGRLSAVTSGSSIAWGKGHAGATSGNGALVIPCSKNDLWNAYTAGYAPEKVGIKTNAFLEIVEDQSRAVAVQLRDGPELPASLDYVPGPMNKVERTISIDDLPCAEDSAVALLEWEKLVANAPKHGTVILLPGKTLGNHFAVHGVVAGLPVLCSDKAIASVRLGKPLEVAANAPKLKADHYKAMANTMARKREQVTFGNSQVLFQTVSTLHSVATWGTEAHLLHLRALMPVVLTRYLAAASLGEMRHFRGRSCLDPALRSLFNNDFYGYCERSSIYDGSFQLAWDRLQPLMSLCASDFPENAAKGGSYGGKKWARIAKYAERIAKATDAFVIHPTPARWRGILTMCNRAINLCHNGGNVLTKWADVGTLDKLSECPALGFMSVATGEEVFAAYPEAA